jgi:uncharacterized protein YndB with AHSA1/START domain
MKRDLHFEMTYPHPREHVWKAVTSPEAMSKWLMKNDFQPRVGPVPELSGKDCE